MNLWGGKRFEGITISQSNFIPVGMQALTRSGKVVYLGKIGDPIEDAEFDGVILSRLDFGALTAAVRYS